MSIFVVCAISVIAIASVAVTVIFAYIAKALVANTESIKLLVDHLDARTGPMLESALKAIDDVKEITERVNGQMDRVENIVGNIEQATHDARSSMKMVDATVVPALSNLHSIVGGIKKGLDAYREQGTKNDE